MTKMTKHREYFLLMGMSGKRQFVPNFKLINKRGKLNVKPEIYRVPTSLMIHDTQMILTAAPAFSGRPGCFCLVVSNLA